MGKKVLFIDRDGTIIKETVDEQIDAFEKKSNNQRFSHTILQKTLSNLGDDRKCGIDRRILLNTIMILILR